MGADYHIFALRKKVAKSAIYNSIARIVYDLDAKTRFKTGSNANIKSKNEIVFKIKSSLKRHGNLHTLAKETNGEISTHVRNNTAIYISSEQNKISRKLRQFG